MALSETSLELAKMLRGCEVNSITYEGCVYIKGTQIWRDGEVVDNLDTDEKVKTLWEEFIEEEGLN